MTLSTLYREGDDTDSLLGELEREHPGGVRVVDVQYVREGGVFGFFAHRRVGLHYQVQAPAYEPEPTALDDLIDAADAAEAVAGTARRGREKAAAVGSPALHTRDGLGNAEFAKLLLELAAAKSSEPPAPVTMPVTVPLTAPVTGPVTPPAVDGAALFGLAHALPDLDGLVDSPGGILAVVGPAAAATRIAEDVRRQLCLAPAAVWTVGSSLPHHGESPALVDACCIRTYAQCHRNTGFRLAVAIVPTEASTEAQVRARLEALAPDQVWAAVLARS